MIPIQSRISAVGASVYGAGELWVEPVSMGSEPVSMGVWASVYGVGASVYVSHVILVSPLTPV